MIILLLHLLPVGDARYLGHLYVVDGGNSKLRVISPDGVVHTVVVARKRILGDGEELFRSVINKRGRLSWRNHEVVVRASTRELQYYLVGREEARGTLMLTCAAYLLYTEDHVEL